MLIALFRFQNPEDRERTMPAFSRNFLNEVFDTCTIAPILYPLDVFTLSYDPATTDAKLSLIHI